MFVSRVVWYCEATGISRFNASLKVIHDQVSFGTLDSLLRGCLVRLILLSLLFFNYGFLVFLASFIVGASVTWLNTMISFGLSLGPKWPNTTFFENIRQSTTIYEIFSNLSLFWNLIFRKSSFPWYSSLWNSSIMKNFEIFWCHSSS